MPLEQLVERENDREADHHPEHHEALGTGGAHGSWEHVKERPAEQCPRREGDERLQPAPQDRLGQQDEEPADDGDEAHQEPESQDGQQSGVQGWPRSLVNLGPLRLGRLATMDS